MTAKEQTQLLANYIMAEIPGEPSRSEGAGDCAVRLLRRYRRALAEIMEELLEQEWLMASMTNAYTIAEKGLLGESQAVMQEGTISDDPYAVECCVCSSSQQLRMYAHRSALGKLIGWVFCCKDCYVAGSKITIVPKGD